MKRKSRITKGKGKAKSRLLTVLICVIAISITVAAKGNQPKLVGYTYDTGSTVWEIAEKHCPSEMDIRKFVKEIEEINGIENAVVHNGVSYKIPVYTSETDYLDMNTVSGYEVSDNGVMLLTYDGNGYFIEK